MSVRAKFDALVKGLDESALATLRESVAAELEGRGGGAAHFQGATQSTFEIGAIRPGMSAADKQQAMQEIARALREQ
jgi:hypothetical protein